MKAIIVIDVPDNTEFDKDYRLTGLLLANEYAENVGIEFKGARLKPMPEELPTPYMMRQIQIANGIQTETPPYTEEYQIGYNDCIDDILGEEE